MESVLRLAAMPNRVRQWCYHFLEFNDRTRPAMRDNERTCVVFLAPNVNEMNIYTIKTRFKLWELVEFFLSFIPVIFSLPVFAEFLMVLKWQSLGPVVWSFSVRPPGAC